MRFGWDTRVGIVANSDGHKGRPGASYPGAALFGAVGGLTCFLVPELTRQSIWVPFASGIIMRQQVVPTADHWSRFLPHFRSRQPFTMRRSATRAGVRPQRHHCDDG